MCERTSSARLLESVRWSRLQERWIGAAVSIVLGAVVASGLGCRMTMPERKIEAKIHPQKDIAANQNKVRLRMRALVEPMCAELEQAADAIIAGTTNASVKKAALRWKIEGVPALREALFQPDGLAALGDAWVLCNQMADYFDKGPGRSSLEEASHRAGLFERGPAGAFVEVVGHLVAQHPRVSEGCQSVGLK